MHLVITSSPLLDKWSTLILSNLRDYNVPPTIQAQLRKLKIIHVYGKGDKFYVSSKQIIRRIGCKNEQEDFFPLKFIQVEYIIRFQRTLNKWQHTLYLRDYNVPPTIQAQLRKLKIIHVYGKGNKFYVSSKQIIRRIGCKNEQDVFFPLKFIQVEYIIRFQRTLNKWRHTLYHTGTTVGGSCTRFAHKQNP